MPLDARANLLLPSGTRCSRSRRKCREQGRADAWKSSDRSSTSRQRRQAASLRLRAAATISRCCASPPRSNACASPTGWRDSSSTAGLIDRRRRRHGHLLERVRPSSWTCDLASWTATTRCMLCGGIDVQNGDDQEAAELAAARGAARARPSAACAPPATRWPRPGCSTARRRRSTGRTRTASPRNSRT